MRELILILGAGAVGWYLLKNKTVSPAAPNNPSTGGGTSTPPPTTPTTPTPTGGGGAPTPPTPPTPPPTPNNGGGTSATPPAPIAPLTPDQAIAAAAAGNVSIAAGLPVLYNVDQWNWWHVTGGGREIAPAEMDTLIDAERGEYREQQITAAQYLERLARLSWAT